MLKAVNIHDLAREYLATEGLKLKDTQKRAVFEFADWILQKAAQPARELVDLGDDRLCENCGERMSQHVGQRKLCKNGEWNNWGAKPAQPAPAAEAQR